MSVIRRTSTPILLRRNLCSPCSLPSLSLKESSSNSDSVRVSRLLRLRVSTRDESLSRLIGIGLASSMVNSRSRVGTLCGEWICRQTLSTAVSVSMKSETASSSRPQPKINRQRNGKVSHSRPSLRAKN